MLELAVRIRRQLEIRATIRNWPTYLINNKLRRRREITLQLRNGIRYVARRMSGDITSILDVWLRHVYDPPGFHINANDTVVDIGAHSGVFSIYAGEKAHGGTVYAFEPVLANFEILRRNVDLNHMTNVKALNFAVASITGEQDIFLSSNDLAHTLHRTLLGDTMVGRTRVKAIALAEIVDRYCPTGIDFLKMNCEGAEYDILLNCPERVTARIRMMTIQYHNVDEHRNLGTLRENLQARGFAVEVSPQSSRHNILYAFRA